MDYLLISTCYFEYLHSHLCNTMPQLHGTKLQNHTLAMQSPSWNFHITVNLYCFKQHNSVAVYTDDSDTLFSWDSYLHGFHKDG
jgi:hypothetical protein